MICYDKRLKTSTFGESIFHQNISVERARKSLSQNCLPIKYIANLIKMREHIPNMVGFQLITPKGYLWEIDL